jgi:ribosomal protein S18 acetylase RimI-like enzyme
MHHSGRYILTHPTDRAEATRGLRVLMGGPEASPFVAAMGKEAEIAARVDGFLGYADATGVDILRQVIAFEIGPGEQPTIIAGMCLWVPAPGRTAMLFGPSQSEHPETAAATAAAVVAALEDARAHGVLLVQALVEPADAAGKTVFAAAGMTHLAALTYMERKPPIQPPEFSLPADLLLEPYCAATHQDFCDAILASYEHTLDCPALSGLRSVEDIVAGHKAVGPFDPQLWSVLKIDGRPVGCLLLAEVPARHALELVYLGLAPSVRGRGLGRLLMRRVLAIASRRHFELATLAVDAANVPAVRLYRRSGYASVGQRIALIKRLG